jgi:hypothetical protein
MGALHIRVKSGAIVPQKPMVIVPVLAELCHPAKDPLTAHE